MPGLAAHWLRGARCIPSRKQITAGSETSGEGEPRLRINARRESTNFSYLGSALSYHEFGCYSYFTWSDILTPASKVQNHARDRRQISRASFALVARDGHPSHL